MPAFRYEAVDTAGATRKGVVNADSPRSARADLRTQGLTPLSVEQIAAQVDETGATRSRGLGERLSQVELALFTRQLASLLEAGLPLEQAFTALLEQAERAYMRDRRSPKPRERAAPLSSTWAAMASTASGVRPCRRRSARAARGLSAFSTPLRVTPPVSTAS